jgi:Signal peptidase, peptidase S26
MQVRDDGIFVGVAGGPPASPLDRSIADVPPRPRWTTSDRVPSGCYIALGDNRNDSEDSHIFGCVESNHITGKLVKIL